MLLRTLSNYRTLYLLITGTGLSIIVGLVSSILAIDFPQLRFYGKWIFAFVALLVFLNYLAKPYNPPKLPGAWPAILFFMACTLHDLVFPSFYVDTNYGYSVVLLLAIAAIYWYLPKNIIEYRLLIAIQWLWIAFGLTYYIYYLFSSGAGYFAIGMGVRQSSEQLGAEINGNTLSFMAVIWAILGYRWAELSSKKEITYVKLMLVLLNFVIAIFITILNQSIAATLMCSVFIFVVMLRLSSLHKHFFYIVLRYLVLLVLLVAPVYWLVLDSVLLDAFTERLLEGGSARTIRIPQALSVLEKYSESPIFGMSADRLLDGTSSLQHTFYINILAVYGTPIFILFMSLVLRVTQFGWSTASTAQKLARVFFLGVWLTAPSSFIQVVALFVIIPEKIFRIYLSNYSTPKVHIRGSSVSD